MLIVAGKKYAKTDTEVVDSLFSRTGTCSGFYRVRGKGVLLLNLQRQPFAYAFRDGHHAGFVAADLDKASGKVRYMFGLDSLGAARLGIADLSYGEQSAVAQQAIMDALGVSCWPPVVA